jgi:hypothetical protein
MRKKYFSDIINIYTHCQITGVNLQNAALFVSCLLNLFYALFETHAAELRIAKIEYRREGERE